MAALLKSFAAFYQQATTAYCLPALNVTAKKFLCRSRPFDQIPRLQEEDLLTRVLACSYVSVWLPRCNHVTPSISLYTPTNKLVFEPLVNGNIYRRIDAYRLSIHNRLSSYNNRLPYEHGASTDGNNL